MRHILNRQFKENGLDLECNCIPQCGLLRWTRLTAYLLPKTLVKKGGGTVKDRSWWPVCLGPTARERP